MFKALWKLFFPKYASAQYETVRYAFPLVIITAVIAGLAAIITGDTSYITIHASTESVVQGSDFYIDVSMTAAVPVNAIDLVIAYPANQIDIVGVDTGMSVITLWTEQPYAKDGNIYLRGGTFRKGFLGEHPIARIHARAKSTGEAKIYIKDTQAVAGDGVGTEISLTKSTALNEAKITVTGVDGTISGKASIAIITDTNGDGIVDLRDVSAFMAAWFTGSKTFDFNGDGKMTITDFSILLADSFFK